MRLPEGCEWLQCRLVMKVDHEPTKEVHLTMHLMTLYPIKVLQPVLALISLWCVRRTYQLKRGPVGASATAATSSSDQPLLPLWGQLCCNLMAEPECATTSRITGFINIQVSQWSQGINGEATICLHTISTVVSSS